MEDDPPLNNICEDCQRLRRNHKGRLGPKCEIEASVPYTTIVLPL